MTLQLASHIFASWNQMSSWLSQLQGLQRAALPSGQEFTPTSSRFGPGLRCEPIADAETSCSLLDVLGKVVQTLSWHV